LNNSFDEAKKYCRDLAKNHYENFTVGSLFLPKALRQHIYNVYAFSRIADDFADEGDSPEQNLKLLDEWENKLLACYDGKYLHPVFLALSETIQTYSIPIQPFQNLIKAFRQDQNTNRYKTYEDLMGYCQNSANPVGRIYLYLFGLAEEERFLYSDAICTALQLTNFWQDITIDFKKGRIYIPLEDLDQFGCSEDDFNLPEATTKVKEMIKFEVDRTQQLFDYGKKLLELVQSQPKFEIQLFINGGEVILDSIRKQDHDTLKKRPTVNKLKKTNLVLKSLWKNKILHG